MEFGAFARALVLACLTPGLAYATPGIQFATTSFAFGTAMAGDVFPHDFVFTNTGDATLKIIGVYPSCNCTTVEEWTREVPPGQTGRISLQFDSTRFGGPVTETTVVANNDPAHHNVLLSFTGTVKKPVEVNPAMAILKPVIGGDAGDAVVAKIKNNMTGLMTLGKPVCSNPAFSAELKIVVPEREFQLVVRAVPPILGSLLQGTVSMRTSSERVPSVIVPVLFMPQLPLEFSPPAVTLPPGPLPVATNVTVTLRNHGRNVLALADAKIDAPGATVQIQETQMGREFNFLLTFPAGFKLPENREAALSVTPANAETPVLKVPLRALPSSTATNGAGMLLKPAPAAGVPQP